MSELQDIYEAAERGVWSDPNPSRCGCRGHGWFLSSVDTWHECQFHGGTPHPEDEEAEFDSARHERTICVNAYRRFRDEAVALGVNAQVFEALCRRDLGRGDHTPREWVDVANALVDDLQRTLAESNAQAEGFSCDLERRWAQEGEDEAAGWGID